MKTRYKYNVLNSKNIEEEWSGVFQTLEETEKWYKKHGTFHEKNGHKLIRKEIITTVPKLVAKIKNIFMEEECSNEDINIIIHKLIDIYKKHTKIKS